MKIVQVNGDLFNTKSYTDEDVVFAHCIASDFGMFGGIAKQFVDKMDMKRKLFKLADEIHIPKTSYQAGSTRPSLIGKAILIDNVFNLVTKESTMDLPTLDDLASSISDMKTQVKQRGIKYIAIPDMIGCGIDQLDREQVLSVIQSVFLVSDVTIYVVKYVNE